MSKISHRAAAATRSFSMVGAFFQSLQQQTAGHAAPCDFTFGNPHEMPLPGLIAGLMWFACKTSEARHRGWIDRTRERSRITSRTLTQACTVSPGRTGARKRSCWEI